MKNVRSIVPAFFILEMDLHPDKFGLLGGGIFKDVKQPGLTSSLNGLFAVFLTEFVDPSGGINDALFAGIKRMAGRAYFNLKILC